MSVPIPLARGAAAALVCAAALSARAADGPSFDCAHVSSSVNKLICASPELSARDRELAEHYRALQAQPGIDAAALQRDEARWLREVRNVCPDAECIAQAYDAWDAVLQARSRRLANAPAAHETLGFPVSPAAAEDARSLRGKACASGEDVPRDAGYFPVPGALPVVGNGSVVLERQHLDAEFAFLLDTRRNSCRIVDVVALPPHAQAGKLLQCTVPSADGSAAPLSAGVGLRRPGEQAPLAYWEVDVVHDQFIRQPLDTLGWARTIRCQEPEVGD